MDETYCCAMRRHFVLGIVGERQGPVPVDVVDFIPDFDAPQQIKIRFCPFCGNAIDGKQTTRMVVNNDDA